MIRLEERIWTHKNSVNSGCKAQGNEPYTLQQAYPKNSETYITGASRHHEKAG